MYRVTGGVWIDCYSLKEKKKKALILLCRLYTHILYGLQFFQVLTVEDKSESHRSGNRPDLLRFNKTIQLYGD